MITRRDFSRCLLGGAALAAAPALAAPPAPAVDGRRRINLAERQAMLSQQIAKAACFAALGITPSAQLAYVRGSADLFEKTLRALRAGDDALGLLPEQKTDVLIELAAVERVWRDYRQAIDALLASDEVRAESLDAIVALNPAVLAAAEAHATKAQHVYGGSDVPLHLAVAINVAGRQRMLTQKMAKEYALVALDIDAAANRAAMTQSSDLFEKSLAALIDGFPMLSLRPAQNPELRERLASVKELWTGLAPAFARVAQGTEPTKDDVRAIAWEVNPLLVQMNKAVFLYENEA